MLHHGAEIRADSEIVFKNKTFKNVSPTSVEQTFLSAVLTATIGANSTSRWLSLLEIGQRTTNDGQSVSKQVLVVIAAAPMLEDESKGRPMSTNLVSPPTVTWMAEARRHLSEAVWQQIDRKLPVASAHEQPTHIIGSCPFPGVTRVWGRVS